MDELLERVQLAMDSTFIGEVQFDQDDIEDLKEKCFKDCNLYMDTKEKDSIYVQKSVDALIVLIVNICKFWDTDNESKFWKMIMEEIFEGKEVSLNKFYNLFDVALQRHDKQVFLSDGNRRMFREYFLLQALAPKESLDSFIRLLWDWYSNPEILNFDVQHDDALFAALSKYLNLKFKGNYDDNKGTNFGGKLYSIRASFKYLYKTDPTSGINLLKNIFSYIDDRYMNGPIMSNSYLAENCNNTINSILLEINDDKKHKKKRRRPVVTDINKIKASYEYDKSERKVLLTLPEIRQWYEETEEEILDIYHADEYRLELIINDQCVEKFDGYIVGNDISKRIKPIEIDLGKYRELFTKEINIRIKLYIMDEFKEKQIYDSKKTLYRNIIIFNNRREFNRSVLKPDNSYYLMHCSNDNLISQFNYEYVEYSPVLVAILPKENDRIITPNRTIYFNSAMKGAYINLLNVKEIKNCEYIHDEDDEARMKVFKSIPDVSISIDKEMTNINSISVKIDDSVVNTLENSSTLKGDDYHINKKLFLQDEGVHSVEILNVSKNQLINSIEFLVDPFLKVRGDKYIFDGNNGLLTIKNNQTTFYDMVPPLGLEQLSLPYKDGYLIYNLPVIKWRIDQNDWNFAVSGDSFWKDNPLVHNNCILDVKSNSDLIYKVFANDDEIDKSDKETFRIGNYFVKNRDEQNVVISLQVGNRNYELFTVDNEPKLYDVEIDLDNKKFNLKDYYCGKDKCEFSIHLSNEYFEYDISTDIGGYYDQIVEDGYYDAYVTCEDLFGNTYELFNSEEDGEIIVGNPDKHYFTNKIIGSLSFNTHRAKNAKKGKIQLKNVYISHIKFDRIENIGREYSVYRGTLNANKQKYDVEIYKKDDKYLKLFFVKDSATESVHYDLQRDKITTESETNSIIEVSSFKYEII
ncbi:hypothetical protein H5983_04640 [Faecalitalea cylindroides]|uniref:hypothetical protein n=1 Tax=Faecalitalea cylindroides TaxID=39483 RepID=UPI001959C00F|nr:hypothetical protein [Faecalitalea cylindroides]MBM6810359.1 hypothetical protein [Faecalitalea cylindroides]